MVPFRNVRQIKIENCKIEVALSLSPLSPPLVVMRLGARSVGAKPIGAVAAPADLGVYLRPPSARKFKLGMMQVTDLQALNVSRCVRGNGVNPTPGEIT